MLTANADYNHSVATEYRAAQIAAAEQYRLARSARRGAAGTTNQPTRFSKLAALVTLHHAAAAGPR